MLFVELNMVLSDSGPIHDDHEDADETVVELGLQPRPTSQPISLNPAEVREFYSRKHGRIGTRVVMKNGAGLLVTELYPEVKAAMEAAGRLN